MEKIATALAVIEPLRDGLGKRGGNGRLHMETQRTLKTNSKRIR